MVGQKAAQEHTYDPLWGTGAKKKRFSTGANIAIGLSLLIHAGLFYWVYENKFVVHYKDYSDETMTAVVVKPDKPPPPPPAEPAKPPPVLREPAPPPALAPREGPVPLGFEGPVIVAPELAPPEPLPPQPVPQEPPKAVVRTIVNPDWLSRPSGDDVARFYPDRAQRLDMPGNVTLSCLVTAKGAVSGCTVLSEDPMGFRFGEAALQLSRLFRMKPKMEDGQAVEGAVVKIPIAFRLS